MALKYPIVLILTIIIIILILVIKPKKKERNKKKIANTHFIKNTPVYKKVIRKYKIMTYAVLSLLILCVIVSSLITSRVISTYSVDNKIYDRDIMLCLDVSGSMTSLDEQIVTAYKSFVSGMKGERFGIVIFDSSAYTLLPLTSDYDYINDVIDKSITAFKADNIHNLDDFDYDVAKYIFEGAQEGSGSSLVGEGLASCVLSFPNMDKDRSRVIILATDNYVYGSEIITVPEAGELAKKYKISVYPIDPYSYGGSEIEELKDIATKTGGKFYTINDASLTEDVIKEIESKERSLRETNPVTIENNIIKIPLICLIVLFVALLVMERMVKL